jgi:hypothetical protein
MHSAPPRFQTQDSFQHETLCDTTIDRRLLRIWLVAFHASIRENCVLVLITKIYNHTRPKALTTLSALALAMVTNLAMNGRTSKDEERVSPVGHSEKPVSTTTPGGERFDRRKRALLSLSELETIRNNAPAVLAVHECFAEALMAATAPFGLPTVDMAAPDPVYGDPPPPATVQQGITAVARAFSTSAPTFASMNRTVSAPRCTGYRSAGDQAPSVRMPRV